MWKRSNPSGELNWALRNIDLTVRQGATLGIIGRNGAGKSTLLHVMRGIMRPTSGTILVGGRLSALIELGVGFHPDLTGRENVVINGVLLGLTKDQARERCADIIRFAELEDFVDEPISTYSTGMYMRLGFSVAIHVNPDILLIDEVLAVGDLSFVAKCRERMMQFKRSGKTIVLVTHDLVTVGSWCDEALWLHDGLIRMVGDPGKVIDHYQTEMGKQD
jgi:lipopolysaccharide transport system ATP-binding protein